MQRAGVIGVIDDDHSFREALVDSLASLGIEARGYTSAEDFIIGNGQGLCEVVVTDVHMRGMSGLDLIHYLAVSGSRMPVVLITARSETKLEARAEAAGAICILEKPFRIDDLIIALKRRRNYGCPTRG